MGKDLVTLGMIEDLEVDASSKTIRFLIRLTTPSCPLKDRMEADCRTALAEDWGTDLQVEIRMEARGTVEVPAGIPISAYAMQGGSATFLATEYTTEAIPSGSSTTGIRFDLDAAAVGTGTLEFRADDADGSGSLLECHEDNNVLPVDDGLCP